MKHKKNKKHKLTRIPDSGETARPRLSASDPARWLARIVGLAAILVFLRPTDAHAYVDPSTGSYLLQMLLAGVVAAALAIRMFWTNLKLFFHKLFSKSNNEETDKND